MYNQKFLEFRRKAKCPGVCVCFPDGWKSETDKVVEFPLLDASCLSLKYT